MDAISKVGRVVTWNWTFRWRPRFSLRSLFLATLVVSMGLALCQLMNLRFSCLYTGRPMDLAINGAGYFQIVEEFKDEPVYYTRYGRFWIDNNSQIRFGAPDQHLLLHPRVTVPTDGQPKVTADGEVLADIPGRHDQNVGVCLLAHFSNPDGLAEVQPGMLRETDESGQPLLAMPGNLGLGTCSAGWLEMRDPQRQDSAFSISPAVVAAFVVGAVVGLLLPRPRTRPTPPLPTLAGGA